MIRYIVRWIEHGKEQSRYFHTEAAATLQVKIPAYKELAVEVIELSA